MIFIAWQPGQFVAGNHLAHRAARGQSGQLELNLPLRFPGGHRRVRRRHNPAAIKRQTHQRPDFFERQHNFILPKPRQRLIIGRHQFVPVRRTRQRIVVGMPRLRQLAEGGFDFVLAGRCRHAEKIPPRLAAALFRDAM